MAENETGHVPVVVLDLGKVKRRRIRELKAGHGVLVDEVQEAVASVEGELGPEAEGKTLLPVVVVYRRKRKKRKRFFGW